MTSTVALTVRGESSKDLVLQIDAGADPDQVRQAIQARLPFPLEDRHLRVERTGRLLEQGPLDLLMGDVLSVVEHSHASPRAAVFTGDRVSFRVEEGSVAVLGRKVVGEAGVVIDDHTVSSRHAAVKSEAGTWWVEDLGSTNGTAVNGEAVTLQELQTGDELVLGGAVRFTVNLPESIPSHVKRSRFEVEFSPPPREMGPRPELEVDLGSPPEPPNRRRLPIPAVAAPLVFGLIGYLLLESPAFLIFSALSPLMALWNWLEDRRGGASEYRRHQDRFLARLEETRARLTQWELELRSWYDRVLPSPDRISSRVASLSPQLWNRRPVHADFLVVRVGTATQPGGARIHADVGTRSPLAEEAAKVAASVATLDHLPVELDLKRHRVVGLVGSTEERRNLARWVAIQASTHHSPNHLILLGLGGARQIVSPWLPHVRQASSSGLDPGGPDGFESLQKLVDQRLQAGEERWSSGTRARRTILVVVEPPVDARASDVSRLLTKADQADLVVVWLAESESALPGECSVVVDHTAATVRFLRSGDRIDGVSWEGMNSNQLDRLARRLAPLVDASSIDEEGSVPEFVSLFELLGGSAFTAEEILSRWNDPPAGLVAPVGFSDAGPLELDLTERGDGPHGLVAGTTGAGKSEFLQTLVASLAATYPPEQLTFLFVDYKGGSAFRECVALPHCVGVVTNLDEGMADRVRRSLVAERQYRERVLDRFGVSDLDQLRKRHPEHAFPSLLIVFDEFAALTTEIPEFIDAVVDIAQKGRSLGMHLLLATQTPGGVVGPKIQNCVSLRVALRLKDPGESTSVLDSPLAASIAAGSPGRAYARRGDNTLVTFQAGYANSPYSGDDDAPQAVARTLFSTRLGSNSDLSDDGPSELEVLVEAVRQAQARRRVSPPRRPWLAELAPVVSLDQLDTSGWPESVVGMADYPDQQAQRAHVLDWKVVRNALVVGAGGSGKTTVIRTVAISAAKATSSDALNLVVIHPGTRELDVLGRLPHVAATVTLSDGSHLRRVMAEVEAAIDRRRQSSEGPSLLVLVDGLVPLLASLEDLDGGRWMNSFLQSLVDGPAAGVHFVITTDQPQRVPSTVLNACGERLILRLNTPEAYAAAGIHPTTALQLGREGRAWSASVGAVVQVAVVGEASDQAAQLHAIGEIAARSSQPSVRRIEKLAEHVAYDSLKVAGEAPRVLVGLDDELARVQSLDVSRIPTLLVIGPDLSGRSTSLATIRKSMADWGEPFESVLMAPQARGEVHQDPAWSRRVFGLEAIRAALDELAASGRRGWTLVAIDDCDDLAETPMGGSQAEQLRSIGAALEELVKVGRETRTVVVAAGRFPSAARLGGWAARMRQNGQGVILSPTGLGVASSEPFFGARIPRRSGLVPRPGWGLLVRQGAGVFIQMLDGDS